MCVDVLGMHGEVEDVFRRAGHAGGGGGGGMERGLGVLVGSVACAWRCQSAGNGLGACEADGRAVVVEVGATAVLEGLRGRIEDA